MLGFSANFEDAHGLGDILDPLLAEGGQRDRQPGPDLIAYRAGQTNPSGLGHGLQPGGNIDPVAKQIRPLDDNVS